MKKQLLLLTLLLSTAINAFAVEVEIGGLWYEVITKAKEAKVIQYKNNNYYRGDIVIPESVEYNGVTCSVTSIVDYAFSSCRALTSVTIPNSVTSIGNNAFYCCYGLTSVTIGNSVTSIGSYAFSYCSALTSVTIPNSVTSIGEWAFEGCSGLTSVSVDAGNTVYDSRDNCNAIIETASNTLITGCKSTIIPNSVTSIGYFAFRGCSGLTSVTIPNSVTSIGDYAFYDCSGLTSVTIPNSVTSIGREAFNGCSGLTSVTIPNSVTSIGIGAFYNCSKLISVTIGSGIKYIGSSAFAKCTELTDVYCYAKSVPSTISDAFADSYIEYATLHVPTASIDAYKSAAPWSEFKTIVGLEGTLPDNPTEETKKCATPTIKYIGGKLLFECETEGVEFVYSITTPANTINQTGNNVDMPHTNIVSVYAKKEGYQNSDVATEDIDVCGLKGDVNGDGKVDVSDVVGTANIILQKQ